MSFYPARRSIMSRRVLLTALFAGSISLIACSEREANPVGPDDPGPHEAALNEIVVTPSLNATNTDHFVYFSFQEGRLVPRSAEWELALRRNEVWLNSPSIAGEASRDVRGYAMNNNRNATNEQVLGFTAANTLAAFDSVRAAQIPPDASFMSDMLVEDATAYLTFSVVPVANASAYWKLRLANGAYAVFRVSRFSYTNATGVTSLVIDSRIQEGSALGPMRTLTVSPEGVLRHISLVQNALADAPDGCNWDLLFDPDKDALSFTLNAGCGTASYPGPSSPAFPDITRADDAPDYRPYLAKLVGPIPFATDDPGAPFRYNLDRNSRMHPAFNTFLILAGEKVYKMQVIDYYNDTGASGWPKIRYARIR